PSATLAAGAGSGEIDPTTAGSTLRRRNRSPVPPSRPPRSHEGDCATMLGTRVLSGSILIALVLAPLCLDEWAAPWYPLWFVFSTLVLAAGAVELVGLLRAAGSGPSLNSVLGGVMALVVSNWMPHISDHLERSGGKSAGIYEPNEPISILSWPLLTFVGV